MIYVDENLPVGDDPPQFEHRSVVVQRPRDVHTDFEMLEEIGRGKFGRVMRCKHWDSGENFAAKFIIYRKKEDRENVEREVEIMNSLNHPKLLFLFEAYDNARNEMCLVTEYIPGGELFDRVIEDEFVLTEKACICFIRQILDGVAYMHAKQIVHLDLKPENILCPTKTGNRIKIIDFGLARRHEPHRKLQVLFGTPEFVAPEVVNFEPISYATDMWALGVITYVLLSGLSPFMGDNDLETMANVTIAEYDYEDEAFNNVSTEAKDFIDKLLVKKKEKRLTAETCMNHKWLSAISEVNRDLSKNKQNIKNVGPNNKYYKFDPQNRTISVAEPMIEDHEFSSAKEGLIAETPGQMNEPSFHPVKKSAEIQPVKAIQSAESILNTCAEPQWQIAESFTTAECSSKTAESSIVSAQHQVQQSVLCDESHWQTAEPLAETYQPQWKTAEPIYGTQHSWCPISDRRLSPISSLSSANSSAKVMSPSGKKRRSQDSANDSAQAWHQEMGNEGSSSISKSSAALEETSSKVSKTKLEVEGENGQRTREFPPPLLFSSLQSLVDLASAGEDEKKQPTAKVNMSQQTNANSSDLVKEANERICFNINFDARKFTNVKQDLLNVKQDISGLKRDIQQMAQDEPLMDILNYLESPLRSANSNNKSESPSCPPRKQQLSNNLMETQEELEKLTKSVEAALQQPKQYSRQISFGSAQTGNVSQAKKLFEKKCDEEVENLTSMSAFSSGHQYATPNSTRATPLSSGLRTTPLSSMATPLSLRRRSPSPVVTGNVSRARMRFESGGHKPGFEPRTSDSTTLPRTFRWNTPSNHASSAAIAQQDQSTTINRFLSSTTNCSPTPWKSSECTRKSKEGAAKFLAETLHSYTGAKSPSTKMAHNSFQRHYYM